ncbi:glycosyltransferase [Chenggangzhangella methanolivorans]|uniref:glycosyltransferase n=1 Tax=Chenggangzhangella methanolivorans TaxID=1437009 RepID=UPI0021BD3611|nr:glycosyltransferase family A protein [Chenggangzhangella methanolivorans]
MSSSTAQRQVCVCVPARNEQDRLPRLLRSLAQQDWEAPLPVVIALNNTSDGSRDVVQRLASELADRLRVFVDEQDFEPSVAHAGSARRRAMDVGLDIVGGDDGAVLLTTDADARPPRDWVRRNVETIIDGADLVGGALMLGEDEAVPLLVRSRWEALSAYWRAVRAIEDEIDPVAWDPPPRHGDHTGGSLATTAVAYRATGGVPAIPVGEDGAYVMKARALGFRLRHPATVWTRVSPRTDARAIGGMATKMQALAGSAADAMAAPSLEQWRERAHWRRSVRLVGGDARVAALEPDLAPMICNIIVTPAVIETAA